MTIKIGLLGTHPSTVETLKQLMEQRPLSLFVGKIAIPDGPVKYKEIIGRPSFDLSTIDPLRDDVDDRAKNYNFTRTGETKIKMTVYRQVRFPRSRKRRIRQKWTNNIKNYRAKDEFVGSDDLPVLPKRIVAELEKRGEISQFKNFAEKLLKEVEDGLYRITGFDIADNDLESLRRMFVCASHAIREPEPLVHNGEWK